MVERMLLGRGLKNMGNKIIIHFIAENIDIELDFDQPDLSLFVKRVLSEHLRVTDDNLRINSTVDAFDTKEFAEILVNVHEEFVQDLDRFFENIEKEVSTYYDDELSDEIIRRIRDIR